MSPEHTDSRLYIIVGAVIYAARLACHAAGVVAPTSCRPIILVALVPAGIVRAVVNLSASTGEIYIDNPLTIYCLIILCRVFGINIR